MEFSSLTALYALLSANVYGTTNNGPGGAPLVRSERNTLPLPSSDWVVIAERISSSGFMARAYREISTGKVVVAYAGTTDESHMDWFSGNIRSADRDTEVLATVAGLRNGSVPGKSRGQIEVFCGNPACTQATKDCRGGRGMKVSLTTFFRLFQLAFIVTLLAMSTGCSRMSLKWREEVRLSNGQLITVDRTAKGAITRDIAMRATGWKPKETTLRIRKSELGVQAPPVWRSILIPVVLDYDPASSSWTVVATYLWCSTWYDMGRPASPYVQFVSSHGEPWRIVPLQPDWVGRRANLLTDIDPTGEPDLVREEDKEVIWKRMNSEQFQSISLSWKTNC